MALNLNKIGTKIGHLTREYDWKDVVTYALGVGAGYDELEYCYEDGLKVIPGFAAASAYPFLAESGIAAGVNPAGLLHGEQDIIFHSAIPTKGALTSKGKIVGLYDKGKEKGALLVAEADTFHDRGQKLFTNVFTLFCRLDGGFGGPAAPRDEVAIPDRAPDIEDGFLPADNQPLFYRLSGDLYPLHADPKFAQKIGFDRPIMHGLCTQGYTCRILIKHLFPGEPERIKRLRVRFSRPLYPNVPVKVLIWKTDEHKGMFQVVNAQTDEKVIDRGIIEWKSREEAEASARQRGIH
jgi:acyl dehydratase